MSSGRISAVSKCIVILLIAFVLAPTAAPAQQPMPIFPNRPAVPPCPPGQKCAVQSPQFGLRCQTQTLWCGLPQPGPVGVNCFCNTPTGPAPGRVTQ